MRTLEDQTVLSQRDKDLLTDLKEVIRQFEPSATVLLYGSVARGTNDAESDYDILILTDTPLHWKRKRQIGNAVFDFELTRCIVFSLAFRSQSEWEQGPVSGSPFHAYVEEEGILL